MGATSINWSAIPDALRRHSNWVAWRLERRRGDRLTKVPYHPMTGDHASTTDPVTWCDFDAAREAVECGDFNGVGFVFTATPLMGVDLDHIRDTDTGELSELAARIVEDLDSYTEVSPSGDGLHILLEGQIPGDRSRKGAVEMYDAGRFFTVTGHHVEGTPTTVEHRPDALADVYGYVFDDDAKGVNTSTTVEAPGSQLSDDEVIDIAGASTGGDAFDGLWSGDLSGYSSHSEADLALCSRLAFWTGGDAAQMDRLFRRSGLYREKWERDDYRQRTIAKAIGGQTDFYTGAGGDRSPVTGTVEVEGAEDLLRTIYECVDPVAIDAELPGVRKAARWLQKCELSPLCAGAEGVKAADPSDWKTIRRIFALDVLEDAGMVKPGGRSLSPWWGGSGPFLIFPYHDAVGEVATMTFHRCFDADAIEWWNNPGAPPASLPLREGLDTEITQPQRPFGAPEQLEIAIAQGEGGKRFPLYVTSTELEALALQWECRRAIAAPPTSKGRPVKWRPQWCEGWDRLPGVVIVSDDRDFILSVAKASAKRLGRQAADQRIHLEKLPVLAHRKARTLRAQIRRIESTMNTVDVSTPPTTELGRCARAFHEAKPISDADLFGAQPILSKHESERPAIGPTPMSGAV